MANKPEEFHKFTPLDPETVKRLMAKISQYLDNVRAVLEIDDLMADQEALYEIVTRVEMRRVYFYIYHPVDMGELNEGALLCFWILKLMPFRHKTMPNTELNVKIAYTLFKNMLFYVAAKTKRKVNIKSKLMDNTIYAFQYRDLSKEAIMALAESHLH